MPAVICNTSALQYLHQIDRLDLLPALFGQVQIPDAVAAELDEGKRRNVSLPALEDLSWVTIRPCEIGPSCRSLPVWGTGRRKSSLSDWKHQTPCSCLTTGTARRYAIAAGLELTGTLGILVLAKERGLIDSIRPALDRLQASQFRLSAATRQMVLNLAGEGEGT